MARTVLFGNNDPFTIEDDTLTIAEIKEIMSEYYTDLKNASHRIDGDKIIFEVKAGTKGARTVLFGNNDPFTIEDDSLTIAEIKEIMSEYYTDLKNASHRIDGDKIIFEVKAGTKGTGYKTYTVEIRFVKVSAV